MNTDHRWIARNFEKLVDGYGGSYVAVVNCKVVASGARPDLVEARARKATGAKVPSVVMVPVREIFEHAPVRLFGLS